MTDTTVLFESRTFLDADRLDAVRAYLEVTKYSNPDYPPVAQAGFILTEEGEGHFSIYCDPCRVRTAAARVVATLQRLIDEIDLYELAHPSEAIAGDVSEHQAP